MDQRILLIEDNAQIAKSVQLSLQPEGYAVTHVDTLEGAQKFSPFTGFCLAIVDVMLPDGNGLEFCTDIRMHNPDLPIVIITAKADEESIVEGLAVATDYVRKPFGKRELLARIQKILQTKISRGREIEFAGLTLKVNGASASYLGKPVALRPKEFALLSVLVVHGGEFVARERILNHIDKASEMFDRSLDAHVSRIRKAFKEIGLDALEIIARQGSGYALRRKI